MRVFREGHAEYNRCLFTMTHQACEQLPIDMQNYEISIATYLDNPETSETVQEKDDDVRFTLEGKPVNEPVADVIRASKLKFQKDMLMFRKL